VKATSDARLLAVVLALAWLLGAVLGYLLTLQIQPWIEDGVPPPVRQRPISRARAREIWG
jgi:hypothetical protein